MEPIFLEVHHKDTRDQIKKHIADFNTELKNEWDKDKEVFIEKYHSMFYNQQMLDLYMSLGAEAFKKKYPEHYDKARRKTTLKSCKIKYQTATIVFKILDAFSVSLKRNKSAGITDSVFRTSNGYLSDALCVSKTTVWRHIRKATYCNIFDQNGYVWHGSNSSYQLQFNPEVLVSNYNSSYTDLSLKAYQAIVNNLEIPVEKRVEIVASRPRFSDAPNGCMISFCNHIVSCNNLQEHNINMNNANFVDNINKIDVLDKSASADLVQNVIESSHFSINKTTEATEKGFFNEIKPLPSSLQATSRQEQRLRPGPLEKVDQSEEILMREFYVNNAIRLVLATIYQERSVKEHDILLAKKYLRNYFNPTHDKIPNWQLNRDLQLSVFESYKSIRRKGFIPPPLYSYFDPYQKGGFYWTLKHVQDTVIPYMERKEDSAKSISELMKLIRIYRKNSSYDNYRNATQILGKKKNKIYLEYFNLAVVSPDTYTNEVIREFMFNTQILAKEKV